jgi:hypothetical protein
MTIHPSSALARLWPQLIDPLALLGQFTSEFKGVASEFTLQGTEQKDVGGLSKHGDYKSMRSSQWN